MTPHQIAAEIAQINNETVSFLRAQAKRAYALVNTPGQQQEILDAFPAIGLVPAQAVAAYAAFQAALAAVGAADGIPAPDLTIFQPQLDGSVLYVAPPPPLEPEPEETEEPQP